MRLFNPCSLAFDIVSPSLTEVQARKCLSGQAKTAHERKPQAWSRDMNLWNRLIFPSLVLS